MKCNITKYRSKCTMTMALVFKDIDKNSLILLI